ncbi:MAG: hypothetical protein HY370_03195 [Proteobacteria bacterium]|nr:hypothetical protein [Pseudomonadota bacterium]
MLALASAGSAAAQEAPQYQGPAPAVAQVPGGEAVAGETNHEESVPKDFLQDELLRVGLQDAYQRKAKISPAQTEPRELKTLLFTPWQYALLQEAKIGFLARPPTAGELAASGDSEAAREMGIRELSLGGIVFFHGDKWTIWLNGQRVEPDALPEEIIDLKVRKEYVDLKWFDSYTNVIYPVRLRPHQRFNLDSRIFLPGRGT